MSDLIDESGSAGIDSMLFSGGTRIINARGTEDGLILRIDGKSNWNEIVEEMKEFLESRRGFLKGGEVSIEWLDRLPTKEQSHELETMLKSEFGIEIAGRRRRPLSIEKAKRDRKGVAVSLFEHEGRGGEPEKLEPEKVILKSRPTAEPILDLEEEASEPSYMSRMARLLGEELPYEEEANARVFIGTLRSGQRLETPFSLVVVGDVNPGADLVAGGDIAVFGSLRGTAHAGVYDDDGQDRVIVALSMQPMQLRIGSVISRGGEEPGKSAEIARIENRRIVVEAFHGKAQYGRKLR